MENRKLRMAMIGGGRDAFIGAIHRIAINMDGQVDIVAGALSVHPEIFLNFYFLILTYTTKSVHFLSDLAEATTFSINAMPLTPLSVPGKSSHSSFGFSPFIFARTVNTKLR